MHIIKTSAPVRIVEKIFIINNNKTCAFGITADNKDMTHIGHSMINLWLVILEKDARIVIGMTPFSEILKVPQMLANAKGISQRK